MRERLRKIGSRIGYGIFTVFCLLVFASLTFPYEKAKERIVGSFNSAQKGTSAQQELQIDSLGGYWLTGVHASGVRILSAPSQAGKPAAEIRIDEARARLKLLPLLIFRKDIGFSLDLLGGTVDGMVGDHGGDRVIDVNFDGVDVGKLGPLEQAVGLPAAGKLFGNVSFTMPGGKASKGSGKVSLELRDFSLGNGKAQLALGPGMPGLAIDRVTVGTLSIEGEAKDGILKFTKIKATGKDVEIDGDGRIQMRELANESIADITMRLKVNDSYKNKNDKTKGMFAVLDMSPDARAAKQADGFFGIKLTGALGRLRTVPAGSGSSLLPSGPGGLLKSPKRGGGLDVPSAPHPD
ncbi:MAG: type II secretion system protein GspN [Polyangiaceae bacterium]